MEQDFRKEKGIRSLFPRFHRAIGGNGPSFTRAFARFEAPIPKKARDPFVSPRRRPRPVRGPGRGVPGPFWPGSHRKFRGIMRLKRLDRACFFPLRSISRSSESERVSPVEPCSRNRVGFPTGPPHCSEAVVAEASRMVCSREIAPGGVGRAVLGKRRAPHRSKRRLGRRSLPARVPRGEVSGVRENLF